MKKEEEIIEEVVKLNGLPCEPNKRFSILKVYYIPEKRRYYRIIRIDFDSLDNDEKTTYDYLRCNNAKAIYSIDSLCVASFSDKQLAWATISFPESLEEAQETILMFAGTRDKSKLKQYETAAMLAQIHSDTPCTAR